MGASEKDWEKTERDLKDEINWLNAELHGAELEVKRLSAQESDDIPTLRETVEIQENGIIRDDKGWIVGYAEDSWMRYHWNMKMHGTCPCCGRTVE